MTENQKLRKQKAEIERQRVGQSDLRRPERTKAVGYGVAAARSETTRTKGIYMPNLNPRRFSHPETLKKVSRESLITWLAPAREYFSVRGILIPQPGSSGEMDYEKLAGAFIDPEPEMPGYLAESLYMINEMADEAGMDAILEAAEAQSPPVVLAVPEECTPADVALAAWLQARSLLEDLHTEQQLSRPRSFVYFGADGEEVPAFEPPTAAQTSALEGRLNTWYGKKKRGRECQVLVFPNGNECRFLVRHGEPCKREGAIKDGQTTTVFYRPEKFDVLAYDSRRGEIRIHCSGKRELEELRKAFGLHVFGKEDFFPATASPRWRRCCWAGSAWCATTSRASRASR